MRKLLHRRQRCSPPAFLRASPYIAPAQVNCLDRSSPWRACRGREFSPRGRRTRQREPEPLAAAYYLPLPVLGPMGVAWTGASEGRTKGFLLFWTARSYPLQLWRRRRRARAFREWVRAWAEVKAAAAAIGQPASMGKMPSEKPLLAYAKHTRPYPSRSYLGWRKGSFRRVCRRCLGTCTRWPAPCPTPNAARRCLRGGSCR